MKRQASAWLDSARDDLAVSAAILDRDDLTHMVAFHCQQAIEKCLKAVLEEHSGTVPRLHDLITLHGQVQEYTELHIEQDLLKQLNELYADARYPSHLGLLPAGKPPRELSVRMHHLAQRLSEKIDQEMARTGARQ